MKIILNKTEYDIKLPTAISTLADVYSQIEVNFPPGHIITTINLNRKPLNTDWFTNSSKIYLLDDDTIEITVEDSSVVGRNYLAVSKKVLEVMISDFNKIADAFRVQDPMIANKDFVQYIDNLRDYLNTIAEATTLMGRPLDQIVEDGVVFSEFVKNLLSQTLDKVMKAQNDKDWVMLADMIEYEMVPALRKLGILYDIFGVS
jgi:hypothetical protein